MKVAITVVLGLVLILALAPFVPPPGGWRAWWRRRPQWPDFTAPELFCRQCRHSGDWHSRRDRAGYCLLPDCDCDQFVEGGRPLSDDWQVVRAAPGFERGARADGAPPSPSQSMTPRGK